MRIGVHRICGLGDAVQMTPLLRQIRLDCPSAEITCLVSANAAGVLHNAPWIDRLVALPTASVTPGPLNPFLLRMWAQVAAQGPFDLFLHLGPRWLQAVAARLVPAKRRAGLASNKGWKPQPFDTVLRFPANPHAETRHASQVYLDLWTKATGFPDRGLGCSLEHLGHGRAAQTFGLRGDYVCVAPGAGNWLNPADNKRWPARNWQQLMELALAQDIGVAVLGTPGDFPEERLPPGAISLLGRTTLDETASLLRESIGFIGHDSGLFHMALGLDVPAVAFFGPTREDLTGPFRQPLSLVLKAGLPCAPCCNPVCILPDAAAREIDGSPPCMHAMAPAEAWQSVRQFLGSKLPTSPAVRVVAAS